MGWGHKRERLSHPNGEEAVFTVKNVFTVNKLKILNTVKAVFAVNVVK